MATTQKTADPNFNGPHKMRAPGTCTSPGNCQVHGGHGRLFLCEGTSDGGKTWRCRRSLDHRRINDAIHFNPVYSSACMLVDSEPRVQEVLREWPHLCEHLANGTVLVHAPASAGAVKSAWHKNIMFRFRPLPLGITGAQVYREARVPSSAIGKD